MTAEVLAHREGPLGSDPLEVRGPALTIVDEPFRTLLDVRGTAVAPVADGAWAWRLGPDWWLVDAPPSDVVALEAPLAAEVRTGAGDGVSVVDVSCHRTVVVLDGDDARAVLAHGCSIDLHPRVLPVGGCVQGLLAHCQVSIGRTEAGYRVHVRASFARHLAAWLRDASIEHVTQP